MIRRVAVTTGMLEIEDVSGIWVVTSSNPSIPVQCDSEKGFQLYSKYFSAIYNLISIYDMNFRET